MVYKSRQIFLPFCHNTRVWQTDRQTDGQTEFSSQYRVCITCSAVKIGQREASAATSNKITLRYNNKRYKRGCKLVLFVNRKSHTGFRMIPKSVTLMTLNSGVARICCEQGQSCKFGHGHLRRTSGPGATVARWLIVLWLLQYWSKELWVIDICIS